MSNYCTHCGAQLDEDAKFCKACGATADEVSEENNPGRGSRRGSAGGCNPGKDTQRRKVEMDRTGCSGSDYTFDSSLHCLTRRRRL